MIDDSEPWKSEEDKARKPHLGAYHTTNHTSLLLESNMKSEIKIYYAFINYYLHFLKITTNWFPLIEL